MIPEEGRPPVWLRDYDAIEADLARMEDLAAQLDAEVRQNYIPHLARIAEDMTVKLPDPCGAFIELYRFLQAHQATQQDTTNLIHLFRDATGGLAYAADTISKRYGSADAFVSARLGEMKEALDSTATAAAPGTEPATEVGATA